MTATPTRAQIEREIAEGWTGLPMRSWQKRAGVRQAGQSGGMTHGFTALPPIMSGRGFIWRSGRDDRYNRTAAGSVHK